MTMDNKVTCNRGSRLTVPFMILSASLTVDTGETADYN